MSNDVSRTVFLAVPGTQNTRELELEAVRSAVAKGEITLDNWAWSPSRNEWVPLSQLPEFTPAPNAPAEPIIIPAPVKAQPVKVQSATAQPAAVRVTTPAQVPAARSTAVSAAQKQHAATYYSKPIQEHHEFPIFKVLFVVLGVIIAALIGVNYCLVDQPFRQNMAKTPFYGIQTHAHLGAFVQPGVLLIHVIPSEQITSDNFADFLTALTQAAPRAAVAGQPFATIGLTSSWLGQYVITADDWNGFADMSGFTPEEKKEYVLGHLERMNGDSLIPPIKNETETARRTREDQVWARLVNHFQTGL
jgi:hypothetical protein